MHPYSMGPPEDLTSPSSSSSIPLLRKCFQTGQLRRTKQSDSSKRKRFASPNQQPSPASWENLLPEAPSFALVGPPTTSRRTDTAPSGSVIPIWRPHTDLQRL
jgi:hypothetical protein